MITNQLLHPASIVVVGASNNVHKPGGAILRNLISGGYAGEMRAVNPKETEVQGVAAYADVKDIPDTDLAILAIPAVMCPNAVEVLAAEKQVRAFIILSAGFGEETHEGALLEDRILETVNKKKELQHNLKNQMDMSVQEIQLLNFEGKEVNEVFQPKKIEIPNFL